MNTNFREIN